MYVFRWDVRLDVRLDLDKYVSSLFLILMACHTILTSCLGSYFFSSFSSLLFPSPSIFSPPNLSHIINLLLHSFWVGQYRGIFSSRVIYCPSLRSGQYCHPRTEYSPVLQSCNNIYLSNVDICFKEIEQMILDPLH